MIAEAVLIISMGMNHHGALPSQNNYMEMMIPQSTMESCEAERKKFNTIDMQVGEYHMFLSAECLPAYDYIEPDVNTYTDCYEFDGPQYELPLHCRESDFPILDNSKENG